MQKEAFIKSLVAEDIGRGDLYSRMSKPKQIRAYIVAKSEGVLAGREYIDTLGLLYGLKLEWHYEDGERFGLGDKILVIRGDSRAILSLERSILNLMLHATSIATLTAEYVEAIAHTSVKLLDTRKTRPLLREFEKYAVRCGGGLNHRMGLDDSLMLKDTHLKTIDDLEVFVREIRKKIPFTAKIEIECEEMEMVIKAMGAGADIVMCDNMPLETIAQAVAYRNAHYPHILVEASGNVTLDTIAAIAQTGVDAISSGSIIHQANWIDLSMKVEGIEA